jgi:phosphate transport system protein
MQKNPSLSEYYLDIIINGRRLERIADLCTNIAEDVIYIKEGEIIRHRKWDK